jgi:hypothetical protein
VIMNEHKRTTHLMETQSWKHRNGVNLFPRDDTIFETFREKLKRFVRNEMRCLYMNLSESECLAIRTTQTHSVSNKDMRFGGYQHIKRVTT